MKIKKIISYLLVSLLLFTGIKFTLATETLTYEKAKELAEQYITNSLEDEMWKNNNPHITAHKYFYTDSETKASYIEFKVSCDNTKDCWFVLVNIDWDDVAIPIASPSGVWPGEILSLEANNDKKTTTEWENNYKLYYFSPFEQYIQLENTKEVFSINPIENTDRQLENFISNKKIEKLKQLEWEKTLIKEKYVFDNIKDEKNIATFLEQTRIESEELEEKLSKISIDSEIIQAKEKEIKTNLINKLEKLKQNSRENKKSLDFQKKKEEIKEQILQVSNEKFALSNLDMSYAKYYPEYWSSNEFVDWKWNYNTTCHGQTPCYKQFEAQYWDKKCNVWCTPTAVWILFWYYTLNSKFWINLHPNWNLMWKNNIDSDNMIKALWQVMWTYCDGNEEDNTLWWATSWKNIENATLYLNMLWYKNSSVKHDYGSTSFIFNKVKEEVFNNRRPIILDIKSINNEIKAGHTVVAYWYKATSGSEKIVRINSWYWNEKVDWWETYFYSDIDQNLDAMYLWDLYTFKAYSYTIFDIKK